METLEMTNPVHKILKQCTVEGMVVKLPEGKLDRKLYEQVAKSLQLIGGKWKGNKIMGFVFQQDPTELLSQVAGGEKVNLKKQYQFYGTPEDLCDKAVGYAKIKPKQRFLEPSGGQGAICSAINRVAKNAKIDTYELMELNRTFLAKIPNVTILGPDFMEAPLNVKYPRIIANPPFNKGQDIKHLRRMYDLLEPKGIMTCYTSIGWMYGSLKASKEFRAWLDDQNNIDFAIKTATSDEKWHAMANIGIQTEFHRSNGDRVFIEMIDAGAFQESGTSVRTALVVIEKDALDPWKN